MGLNQNRKIIMISAKNKININELLNIIYDSLPYVYHLKIQLPLNEETQSFISWIYNKSFVIDICYDDSITVSLNCNVNIKERIISKCLKLGGNILKEL